MCDLFGALLFPYDKTQTASCTRGGIHLCFWTKKVARGAASLSPLSSLCSPPPAFRASISHSWHRQYTHVYMQLSSRWHVETLTGEQKEKGHFRKRERETTPSFISLRPTLSFVISTPQPHLCHFLAHIHHVVWTPGAVRALCDGCHPRR